MKLKFLGAAENVTGSSFLVETEKSRILVDCGLYQEREYLSRNWEPFPVRPESIDNVILTHGHLDHCGYLPKLVQAGFQGKIFCTPPTAEITEIILLDAAKLQEEDAEKKKKRHRQEGRMPFYPEVPLYTREQARTVFPQLTPVPYQQEFYPGPDVTACLYDAGHILGAAIVELIIRENAQAKKLIFSGDIGRQNQPVLCPPTRLESVDYVVLESTYGNRQHENYTAGVDRLAQIIRETQAAGGNLVIPAFAVERSQELIFYFNQLLQNNQIPHLVVFLDSPMAIDVTEIFNRYSDYCCEEIKNLIKSGHSPFDFPLLKTTRSVAESKAINHLKGTSIIIAGSGMCTGGRIKHHLVTNITRPESTILFVGYQAQGTLGREILSKPEQVRILGQQYPVLARIEKINGLSVHADQTELLHWLAGFQKGPQKIFLVHGEKEVIFDFARVVGSKSAGQVTIPKYLQEFIL